MSLSKNRDDKSRKSLLKEYSRLLHEKPVITKGCTSAVAGALSCCITQWMVSPNKLSPNFHLRSIASYAAVGLLFTGPSVHHFHAWLERIVPKTVPYMALKKLLLDRVFFCPSYLFIYLYLLAVFEGCSPKAAMQRLKLAYWPALKLNLQVWTPLQFLNLKYIPHQYRAPFMSFMALLWTIYIAFKRMQ